MICCHNPIHCILPPDVLENMANSSDPKIRRIAIQNIEMAAEARVMREFMPVDVAAASLATGGRQRIVYDMRKKRSPLPGTRVRAEGAAASKDPAVNEAYNNSGYTYDFYKKIFKRNSLDDAGMALRSSVHVGKDFNNAFWNGRQMAYGDGDGVIFKRFTKSLDVVGHELTHGVVSFTSRLVYQDEPGALNEHFADVFGSLVKQWRKKETAKKANWLIGDDIIVPAPGRKALRSMADPGTAYNDADMGKDNQRAHMDEKYTGSLDSGGVHWNSGIPNHAFYLAAYDIGGAAWAKLGHVWYKCMLALGPFSQFADAARTTIQIATADYGAANKVTKAVKRGWNRVGL